MDFRKKKINVKNFQIMQYSAKTGNYTRQEIRNMAQKISDDAKTNGFNGEIQVSIFYPELGWRARPFTKVGDEVKIYSYDDYLDNMDYVRNDPNTYQKFAIYVKKHPDGVGGNDINNDCLYNCLLEAVPKKIKKIFPTPSHLKKFLDLDRNDKVPVDLLPKLEEKLTNCKLIVVGDYTYISTKEAIHEIHLILSDEHFSLNVSRKMNLAIIAKTEKKPLVIITNPNDPLTYLGYDGVTKSKNGKNIMVLSKQKISAIKYDPHNSDHVIVKITNKNPDQSESAILKSEYKKFVENANILKEKTNGEINLFKSGNNFGMVALDLFQKMNPHFLPEPILPDEAIWIENATCGPLVYAEKYNGEAYKMDMVSNYGYIMKSKLFGVPVKRGKFVTLTQNEFKNKTFFEFGIYRVKILSNTNPKQFRINKNNYYTHYDLSIALLNKYKMELIEDENPNALLYDGNSRITGNLIFEKFVNFLFKLKSEGVPYAKNILNILWGFFSERNEFRLIHDNKSEFEVKKGKKITMIQQLNNELECFTLQDQTKMYKTNLARIKPFMIAAGRQLMAKILMPYIDSVKRIHTDGIITSKRLNFTKTKNGASLANIEEGNNIGNIRYEGYCEFIRIRNCNDFYDKNGQKQVLKKLFKTNN